jgi:nucleotide-binding universal stress UspA family protein
MILVTCTLASFVAQEGAQNIALSEASGEQVANEDNIERILLPINDIETTDEMVNLSITLKSKRNKEGLYSLNVIESDAMDGTTEKKARKILDRAAVIASATDNHIEGLLRYDLNIINAILNVVKEQKITDLILGLSRDKEISKTFLGSLTEGILSKSNTTTLIYKSFQPLSTIKRHLIVVPDRVEREIGFMSWISKIWNMATNTGSKLVFYGTSNTLEIIQSIQSRHPVEASFQILDDWKDFLILAKDIKKDDNLIIVMSRRDHPSYNSTMQKIPGYLDKYFQGTNFLLIYPIQLGISDDTNFDLKNPSMLESLDRLDDIGKTIASIFRKK